MIISEIAKIRRVFILYLINFNTYYIVDENSGHWEKYVFKKPDPENEGFLLSIHYCCNGKLVKKEEFIDNEALIKHDDKYIINPFFMIIKDEFVEDEALQGEYIDEEKFTSLLSRLSFFIKHLSLRVFGFSKTV